MSGTSRTVVDRASGVDAVEALVLPAAVPALGCPALVVLLVAATARVGHAARAVSS